MPKRDGSFPIIGKAERHANRDTAIGHAVVKQPPYIYGLSLRGGTALLRLRLPSEAVESKSRLPESVVKIRDKAESRKLADARKLLSDFVSVKDGAGGQK